MNFYDKIHELVKNLKETEEYKEYIKLKNEIKQDEETYKMVKSFKEKQLNQQMEYLNTGKFEETTRLELENIYSIIIQKENVRKLLETEMKINIILGDIQKILGEGIKEIVEF